MNLLTESRSLLEQAGYRTTLDVTHVSSCHFEDETILGVILVYDTASDLLSRWEDGQDRFLRSNSTKLRNDPVKVWNIYTIHLTSQSIDLPQQNDPFDIEQDFRGTRKIVRTGIQSRTLLREALLPLLRIQHRIAMSPKHVTQRLAERLSRSSPVLLQLLEEIATEDIANALLEDQ